MTANRLTLGRNKRVTRTADFQRVRLEGDSIRGTFVAIGFLKDENLITAQFGFVTSRRVGGAVVRNRVRRRLREVVRKHQHEVRPSLLIITIAHARAGVATHAQLEQDWLRLANRASILSA